MGHRLRRGRVGPAPGPRLRRHGVSLARAAAAIRHRRIFCRAADCARGGLVSRRPWPPEGRWHGVRDPDRLAAARRRNVLVGRTHARGGAGRGGCTFGKRCRGRECRAGHRDGAFHRSAALRQHEPGQGQRVLLRWYFGGAAERAGASQGTRSRLAHIFVRLQGQSARHGGHRPRAQGQSRPRGQRAQVGQSRAHHGAADRRRERSPPVVGDLRSRADRHLRHPGRDRECHRERAARAAGGCGRGGRRHRARRH